MLTASTQTSDAPLITASRAFLGWLDDWIANLSMLDLQEYLHEKGISPEDVGVISADLVEGFCYSGPLSSPRIASVVEPSARVFRRAHELGVRQFALVQEYHTHDAPEFEQFG